MKRVLGTVAVAILMTGVSTLGLAQTTINAASGIDMRNAQFKGASQGDREAQRLMASAALSEQDYAAAYVWLTMVMAPPTSAEAELRNFRDVVVKPVMTEIDKVRAQSMLNYLLPCAAKRPTCHSIG